MKKALALLLMLCLLLTCGAALAIESPIKNQTQFPVAKEPLTLSVFNFAHSYTRGAFGDQPLWKDMEKLTNIKLDFETYQSDITQKLTLRLTEATLPDVIYKVGLDNATVLKYAQDGIIVPITEYLEQYAPNYYYQIQNDPTLKSYVTLADGQIYGFAYIVSAPSSMSTSWNVRTEWLEKLGYTEVPADLQGLKELLIKFRDSDMNENGEKDEVGLISTTLGGIMWNFYGAFGIGTRGKTAATIDIDENGALRYIPVSDGYRKLLSYMNELYTEKLIYQEIFDITNPILTGVGESNRVFMIINGKQYLGGTYKNEYHPTYTLPVGPDGSSFYAYISSPIKKLNTFVTCDNKHIPETLSYFDYFYSEEGVEQYFMGQKDVTYYLDENGNPYYTDYVKKNADGLTYEEVLGAYVPWAGGNNPSMAEARCFGSNVLTPEERACCAYHVENGVDVYWGEFSYSDEDYMALATYKTDIESYVNESTARFITGDLSLENDWDAYVAHINEMELDEMMQIYQRGLDTYYAVTGVR